MGCQFGPFATDRKSTRLNSSHPSISYAVFCLKKKNFRWQHKEALFGPWALLLMLGLVMMSTASTSIAEFYTSNPAHYIVRQCFYVALGIAELYLTTISPMNQCQCLDLLLLALSIVGLIRVFVTCIGHEANGSRRWLNLVVILLLFFFNDTATTEIYTLSLHDALPITIPRRGHMRNLAACRRDQQALFNRAPSPDQPVPAFVDPRRMPKPGYG